MLNVRELKENEQKKEKKLRDLIGNIGKDKNYLINQFNLYHNNS